MSKSAITARRRPSVTAAHDGVADPTCQDPTENSVSFWSSFSVVESLFADESVQVIPQAALRSSAPARPNTAKPTSSNTHTNSYIVNPVNNGWRSNGDGWGGSKDWRMMPSSGNGFSSTSAPQPIRTRNGFDHFNVNNVGPLTGFYSPPTTRKASSSHSDSYVALGHRNSAGTSNNYHYNASHAHPPAASSNNAHPVLNGTSRFIFASNGYNPIESFNPDVAGNDVGVELINNICEEEEEEDEEHETVCQKEGGDVNALEGANVIQRKRLPVGAGQRSSALTTTNSKKSMIDTSFILQLPTSTLLLIFGFLSGKDLAALQQVCKNRLSELATDDGLWKELYLKRWKLLELPQGAAVVQQPPKPKINHNNRGAKDDGDAVDNDESSDSSDEWAWITSLLQQNERWKDIFQTRHSAERWRIGTLKMFNGCWGFISQHENAPSGSNSNNTTSSGEKALDIFFHRKDIAPEGDWYEDWWLKDTPGVRRSQKCGYWDTFLCGRMVRYKQRAAYAQGRRPQACNISFVSDGDRVKLPADSATIQQLPRGHPAVTTN